MTVIKTLLIHMITILYLGTNFTGEKNILEKLGSAIEYLNVASNFNI